MPFSRLKLKGVLTSYPYDVPSKLANFLASKPQLALKYFSFNPTKIKEDSEESFNAFQVEMEAELNRLGDRTINRQWDKQNAMYRDIFKFGHTGPVETITAMLLSGAAISKNIFFEERANINNSLKAAIASFDREPHPYAVAFMQSNLLNKPFLNRNIERILRPNVPLLRLGRELSDLSMDKIEEYRIKYFGQDEDHRGYGRRLGFLLNDLTTDWRPEKVLYAPDKLRLILKSLTCEHQQDDDHEKVFAVSYFTHVLNLNEIYNQIDEGIRTHTYDYLVLNPNPVTDVVLTNKQEFYTGIVRNFDLPVGEVDMIQGFGPYNANIVCYEDDNDEYQAIEEVFNDINTYAGYVQKGANIAATVGGPTIVGAGAALVSAAATCVQVCAFIGESIVKIVNLLDENDYIGSSKYKSNGDYVNARTGIIPFKPYDMGDYLINVNEERVGREPVTRNWQFEYTYGEGFSTTFDSGEIPGISEDKDVVFYMDKVTHHLINWDTYHDATNLGWEDSEGHSEWKTRPNLDARSYRRVYGTIHCGMPGYGTVKVKPWAQGIKVFEETL